MSTLKGRILIMDDEEMVGEIACQMIVHLGYAAKHVTNGQAAVDEYNRGLQVGERYDVVILDLTIPQGMGGKDVVPKILELDATAKMLVSSGYSTDPIMTHFGDYGFAGVINKPFDLAALQNTLSSFIEDSE